MEKYLIPHFKRTAMLLPDCAESCALREIFATPLVPPPFRPMTAEFLKTVMENVRLPEESVPDKFKLFMAKKCMCARLMWKFDIARL